MKVSEKSMTDMTGKLVLFFSPVKGCLSYFKGFCCCEVVFSSFAS